MKKIIVLIISLTITNCIANAQKAYPFINNYTPQQYKSEGQIWAITQDKNGIMYFGTNTGIIKFDGTNWSKIKNLTQAVRSLAIDSKGTIYVGLTSDFGYLKKNKAGNQYFVSLAKDLDSSDKYFTVIWSIATSNNNTYFCSNNAIFRYNNDSTPKLKKIIKHHSFFLTFQTKNKIFVSTRKQGLKLLKNDSLYDIPLGKKINPWIILPYEKNKFLIETSSGLFVYEPDAKEKQNILTKKYFDKNEINKTDKFIKQAQAYIGAAYLGKSLYAISTIRSGIIIINKKGKIINIIDKKQGLLNNTVQYLFLDNENQLWAGLSYGISHIEINSPFRYIDEKTGIQGSIYNVFRSKNYFYVSTNLGLYYWNKNKFIGIPQLSEQNAMQVFQPTKIFNPKTKKNFYTVATIHGMYKIEKNKASKINNLTPSSTIQSYPHFSKIWLSQYFSIYEASASNFIANPKKIFKCNFLPIVLDQFDSNKIFITNGKLQLRIFNTTTKKITNPDTNLAKNLKFYSCKTIDNKPIFLTNKGLYSYNKKTKKIYNYDSFLNYFTKNKDLTQLEKINKNTFWLLYYQNNKNKIAIIHKKNKKITIDTLFYKRFYTIDNIVKDHDSIMWILSPQKIYYFNTHYPLQTKTKNKLLITKFIVEDSIFYTYINSNSKNIKIKYKNNDISISYILPTFIESKNIQYSYTLIGEKKQKWSDWSKDNYKDYTNLHEGKYSFIVKAKNIYGQETKPIQINFTILAPWYRTKLAYIAYLFLLAILIWIAIKINSIRLKKENEKLEKIVQLRTAEINQQKEELKTQAENLTEINKLLKEKNYEVKQQNEEISTINESLKKANENIKKKNKYIQDSINYASRIQKAVLPSENNFKKFFADYFILYLPKDKISGDFYWLKKIDKYIILVGADSTGHGVPGGFISMLGISLLNEVTRNKKISSPAEALELLRENLKNALKQSETNITKQYDAIDMAFTVFDTQEKTLTYSGAYFPCFVIRNKKLIKLKPVLNPLGIHPFEKPFKNTKIDLIDGDIIYLLSDGYKDQIGENNSTLKSKNLYDILINISSLSLKNQKQALLNYLKKWKNDKKQTDDIMIIAVKWDSSKFI